VKRIASEERLFCSRCKLDLDHPSHRDDCREAVSGICDGCRRGSQRIDLQEYLCQSCLCRRRLKKEIK